MTSHHRVTSVHHVITETLSRFTPKDTELVCGRTTAMTENGFCIGRRFQYGPFHAIWYISEGKIRFYGEDGELLQTVDHRKPAPGDSSTTQTDCPEDLQHAA